MQDYERMPTRDRDDLILLRGSIEEYRQRQERLAMQKAQRKRGR